MDEYGTFSTRDIQAGDRIGAVEETLGKVMTGLAVTAPAAEPLNASIDWCELGSLRLINLEVGQLSFTRSKAHLRDQDDGFSLVTCLGGGYRAAMSDGNVIPVMPGMAALISHQAVSTSMSNPTISASTLVMPRDLVNQVLQAPDDMVAAPPEGGMAAIGLLSGYIRKLVTMKEPLMPGLAHIAQGHILDLLANAYDPAGEWSRAAPNEGVNEARLQQLLGLFAASYADPKASAESFGEKLGISARSVHKTLEKTGSSFSEHLLEKRLQAAHGMLQSTGCAHMRVIDIALAVGFADISYFNRTFRRRFGETPSSVR